MVPPLKRPETDVDSVIGVQLSSRCHCGPVGFILTISPRGWTYQVPGLFLGTNVGSLLAIDRFLPELVSNTLKILRKARTHLW